MNLPRHFILILTVVGCCRDASAEDVAIISGGSRSVYGNSGSDAPFGIVNPKFGNPESQLTASMRYQQVYSASDFLPSTPNGGRITAIVFRANDGAYPQNLWGGHITDIEISLSTTGRAVDSLSPVFSENVGPNAVTVVPRGMTVDAIGISSQPSDWGMVIVLPTPFFYDPHDGNLLLDVRNYKGGNIHPPDNGKTQLDAADHFGDSVSRAFSRNVDATTADTVDTTGLVTFFEITAVPEPGPGALGAFGLLVLCGLSLVRNQRRARRQLSHGVLCERAPYRGQGLSGG